MLPVFFPQNIATSHLEIVENLQMCRKGIIFECDGDREESLRGEMGGNMGGLTGREKRDKYRSCEDKNNRNDI